jgi:hypothetical protein
MAAIYVADLPERRKAELAKLIEKADPARLGYTERRTVRRYSATTCKLGYEGICQQAAGFGLPLRPVQGLGKGQQPKQSGNDAN